VKKHNNILKTLKLSYYFFISLIRNPSAVFFGFLFPFIFIAVFGLIGGNGKVFEVGISEKSIQSGNVFELLEKIDSINLIKNQKSSELEKKLNKGQISGIIDIKEKDDEYVQGIKKIEINLKTSSADPEGASFLKTILSSILAQYNKEISYQIFGSELSELALLNVENIEGRKFTQIDFILPGQLSFALLSTGVFTISFSIITLRKTLVLKRMFATPTPKWVIIFAKVISSMIMGILQTSVIVGVGHFAFNFTLVNGISTFFSIILLAIIGLSVFLGLGLLVSSLGKDEDSISPIANLVTLPQFLLSGAFFSTELFPDFLKSASKILPMTYLNEAMRSVAFEGSTLQEILPQLSILVGIGIIIYLVTLKIFKWD